MHGRLLLIACASTFVLAAGCTSGSHHVDAKDDVFDPVSLSIKQNDKVEWKNVGEHQHTVTIHKAGDGATTTMKDANLDKGTSTDYKFEQTGTYHVFCKIHCQACAAGTFNSGGMLMTVEVKA